MFSSDIVGSDAYLEMPTSSRDLYFQLAMSADDDGFVNPKKIMRIVGASEDDLKVLLAKRFLLAFENGVVVIKHWLIHNMIRKDRYTETQYVEQKNTLFIKENKAYTEIDNSRQPLGNHLATQYRLGKDSIGKDTNTSTKVSFDLFWSIYPKKVGKKKCEDMWKKLDTETQNKILADIPLRMQDSKWLGGYIKDPERYLKHEQWNDEIIKTTAPVVNKKHVI